MDGAQEAKRLKALFVVGSQLPDFEEKDLDYRTLSIRQFRGRVVLLDFGATWSKAWVNETPNLRGQELEDALLLALGQRATPRMTPHPTERSKLYIQNSMNTALVSQALQKVPSANVLINLVSQRVRQLNFGNGGACRPLIAGLDHLSSADIALHEIVEGKMGFAMPEFIPLERPTQKGRARPHGWARVL